MFTRKKSSKETKEENGETYEKYDSMNPPGQPEEPEDPPPGPPSGAGVTSSGASASLYQQKKLSSWETAIPYKKDFKKLSQFAMPKQVAGERNKQKERYDSLQKILSKNLQFKNSKIEELEKELKEHVVQHEQEVERLKEKDKQVAKLQEENNSIRDELRHLKSKLKSSEGATKKLAALREEEEAAIGGGIISTVANYLKRGNPQKGSEESQRFQQSCSPHPHQCKEEEGLETHEGEEVGGGVEVEGLWQQQRPATSQLPMTIATGSRQGFGEEHEKELAKLYEEMKLKDKIIEILNKQLQKLDSTGETLAALVQRNASTAKVVLALKKKSDGLEEENEQLKANIGELTTHSEQQKEEIHKLKKQVADLQGEIEAQKFMSDTFREDFEAERKDREKAHSKMAEMEMQYTNQFQKLAQELEAVTKRANLAERKLKERKSQFQPQVSQSSYIVGKKDTQDSFLEQETKRLKEENEQLKANIEELTKANIVFSSSESSELEEAHKQVDLLMKQLDEQQKQKEEHNQTLRSPMQGTGGSQGQQLVQAIYPQNQPHSQQVVSHPLATINALQAMKEHLDKIEREKQDVEEEKNAQKQEMEAEKEKNSQLKTEVARLTAANEYLKRKINPSDPHSITQDPILQLQVEVRDFQSNITRKENKVKNLTSSRIILERRLQRMKEERDRLAQYNMELLLMKANINERLAVKIAEAEELKKEKEVLLHEIEDMKDEIEARKKEVSLTTEEYENECKDKERIAAVLMDKQGEWDILEQKLNTEIHDLEELVEHERLSASEQQKLDSKKWQQEVVYLESEIEQLEENIQVLNSKTRELQQELQRESKEKRHAIESAEQQKCHLESKVVRLESDVDLLEERLRQSLEQPNFDFRSIARSHVIKKKEISRGAFGTVCKGTYRGCWVAVKEPHELILEGATNDDLKREVGCMAKVHHPNIVTFIGAVFDNQPMPMIILELMDMNLRSKYEEADVSRNLTLKIFQDVAYALHYLHEFREPIIHRDLSAPNVLLKSLPHGQYIAKVGDLGSANLAKFASTAGRGAIIYSAPEMFPSADPDAPRKKHTVKVDTYSYGILLCEVIIRKQPDLDKRREMLSEAEQKWRDMHKLIMNCIKAEPTERPAMSQILTTLREVESNME